MTPQPTPGAAPRDADDGQPVDPRAVRVRFAGADGAGDAATLVVAPAQERLHMTNPSVGLGPLGGAAPPRADPADPDAAVSAQRQVLADGEPTDARLVAAGHARYLLATADGRRPVVLGTGHRADGGRTRREVLVGGWRFEVEVESEHIAALRERAGRGRAAGAHGGPLDVRAIIPGKVVSVSVAAGDSVVAGQQLLVVEAMKMQNELRAPRDGTIDRVGVDPGDRLEVGDLLVVIS